MIKECKIVLNNDAVTVVKFDNEEVQFPSIKDDKAKTVYVKFENGEYCITDQKEEKNKGEKLNSVNTDNKDNNQKIVIAKRDDNLKEDK